MEGVFCGANFSKNVSTPQVRVDMRQNGNDSTVLWDSPQRIAALHFYRLFTAKIFVEFSLKFVYPTIAGENVRICVDQITGKYIFQSNIYFASQVKKLSYLRDEILGARYGMKFQRHVMDEVNHRVCK